MVHSLNKGKSFERDVANFLTEITGEKWMRVPMSGGFQTMHNTTSSQFAGDVFCEAEGYNEITVECKSYNDMSITDLFSDKSKLYSWIQQTETEAGNKPWLLFFKISRKGIYLVHPKISSVFTKIHYNNFIERFIVLKKYPYSIILDDGHIVSCLKSF